MSGSDLDGDVYWISWDKNLEPPRTVLPASYLPPPPKTENEITLKAITKFFCDYIRNDNLGQNSNAWVIQWLL